MTDAQIEAVCGEAKNVGLRAIVHAISEEAKAFYLALGFDPSPLEPMTLMVTLKNLKSTL